MSESYTIDLTADAGSWHWKLYTRGGSLLVADGESDSVEQASAEARTRMIVEHRRATGERHSVSVDRYRHGAARAYRWRAECSCGWLGGTADHYKTAEADGDDHLREVMS